MIITCPRCDTTFSLPDELYKPGKKARCSNCGFVFAMPADLTNEGAEAVTGIGQTASPQPASPPPARKKPKLFTILVSIALLALAGYGGYLIVKAYLLDSPAGTAPIEAGKDGSQSDAKHPAKENLLRSIALDEIRQFMVDNLEIGKVMVIQGFAVNQSSRNKDYVSIEARILDENQKVLARTQQLCGVPLTLFQLQTLPERELKETLNNRTTILVNNTNVPPEGKVPFVVIFPNPPESKSTFEVEVVDVRESPEQ